MSGKKRAAGTITVTGHGTARSVPDVMRVDIAVETRADTVAVAYGGAGERIAAVTAALRAHGVRAADIGTSRLSVRTETTWQQERGAQIVGYVADAALVVSLRDLADDADPGPAVIIAAAVAAGGDDVRLGGLTFGLADPEAVLVTARDAAWENALAKAERYARKAGRALGPVRDIAESAGAGGPVPQLRMVSAAAGAAESSSVPVELGEQEISAHLQVTWELAAPESERDAD
ncbi:SIMPL domain-containing protein [Nocardia sp. NPDC057353]|uniref:SIMPL domain-containing protein n=1 Tax=Nocardia sp. NPDC057353 TaxID=3346104 RepID=UPI003643F15D